MNISFHIVGNSLFGELCQSHALQSQCVQNAVVKPILYICTYWYEVHPTLNEHAKFLNKNKMKLLCMFAWNIRGNVSRSVLYSSRVAELCWVVKNTWICQCILFYWSFLIVSVSWNWRHCSSLCGCFAIVSDMYHYTFRKRKTHNLYLSSFHLIFRGMGIALSVIPFRFDLFLNELSKSKAQII